MNLTDLRQYLPQIRQLAAKFGVKKILVVGSVARQDSTPKSDLDLLVELEQGVSLFNLAGFAYECERLIGVRVDVIPMNVAGLKEDEDFFTKIRAEAIPL
jgi:predicted nucleotidyltransferase